jgi:hypothetical protein
MVSRSQNSTPIAFGVPMQGWAGALIMILVINITLILRRS